MYNNEILFLFLQKNLSDSATVREICSTIKTRGPRAYKNLIKSLHQSSHQLVADQLESRVRSNSICTNNNNETKVTAEPVNSNELPAEQPSEASTELPNGGNTHSDFE